MNEKRLVRSNNDRMVLGVATGLANYLGIDVVIIRVLFVIATLLGGPGIIAYIILAIVMPEENTAAPQGRVVDDEEIVIK